MRPLVAAFGPQQVWNGSIDVFGFPPGWQLSGSQIVKLFKYLSGEAVEKEFKERWEKKVSVIQLATTERTVSYGEG